MKSTRISAILRTLAKHGPCTPHQIAAHLGIPYRCLYGGVNYLKRMEEGDLIHVHVWVRQEGHGGPPIPVYRLGGGEGAERPTPLKNVTKAAPPANNGVAAQLFAFIGKKG